jgi:hypothetical protein
MTMFGIEQVYNPCLPPQCPTEAMAYHLLLNTHLCDPKSWSLAGATGRSFPWTYLTPLFNDANIRQHNSSFFW